MIATLAQKIVRSYENEFCGPFPRKDVNNVGDLFPNEKDIFHGRLEMYFSDIAGYASSADRLARRPKEELIEARTKLSKSFFGINPSLAIYKEYCNEKFAPELYRQMQIADNLRTDLVTIITEVLGANDATSNS